MQQPTEGSEGPVYSSIQYTEQDLEETTDTLCFRVPIKYKIMYKKMAYIQKKRLREAIPGLIEAMARGSRPQNSPVIITINMNIAEAKAEAKAEVKLLIEIKELVEKLYELRGPLPPLQRQIIEKLHKLVRRMN